MKNSRAMASTPDSGRETDQLINLASLVKSCRHCLEQCEQVLDLLDGESYTSRPGNASSIGAHMRHIIDRFQCFFAGLPSGVIDYDARARDKTIETHTGAASAALAAADRRMDSLATGSLSGDAVTVREMVHPDSPPAETFSTVERELMGLVSHSVHHLAIIAMLARSLGCGIGSDLGKAPSTIVYEQG